MKVHIFDKKQVLYVVLAIILLCIGMVCALRAVNRLGAAEAAAGITDWGLSFQSEGAPPVANASQEYLRNFDALYVGDANKKEIYITFDAGFENGNTERILDALKKHGVKATFFLVGNYFETQPELVKRMAEEGHTIGNHTYSHPDMSKIGDIQSFQTELQKNEALYRDILGSEMPKLDGLSAVMKIREKKNLPIIILSAKGEDSDKILGLSMGADDYISKPFNPMELVARVKSQLRRYTDLGDINTRSDNVIVNGRLTFKLDEHVLYADGEPVKLTATETKIVELLMKHPGRIFPAEEIYSRIWNEPAYSAENTVMVHIRRIREKIELNPSEPEYLKVVWGIGYEIEKH